MFSVVMPVHNGATTLAASLASVQAQMWQDFEIIVIDDGSTDHSAALVEALAAKDQRIRLVRQDKSGVAIARNRGAEIARGQLLAFLDSDDSWAPEKLTLHFAVHAQGGAPDASFARIAFLPDRASAGRALAESTVPCGVLALSDVLAENPVCTMSNLVVRRADFLASGGFQPGLDHAEDQEWLARFVAAGKAVKGLDTCLVHYRTSGSGLSSGLQRMYLGWRGFVELYAGVIDLPALDSVYCRYLARRALRLPGRRSAAWFFCQRGLRASPRAFLSAPRRGALTLAGALISLFLPGTVRTRLFA